MTDGLKATPKQTLSDLKGLLQFKIENATCLKSHARSLSEMQYQSGVLDTCRQVLEYIAQKGH